MTVNDRLGGEHVNEVAMDGKTVRGVRENGDQLRVLHLFSREGSVALDHVTIAHHADEPKAAQEWIQRVSARFKGLSVLGGDALYADTDLAEAILAQGEDHVVIASRGTTEGEPLTGDDDFRINRWH